MIFHFAMLSVKERFRGTYLGLLWTAIEPALVFLILYTVFTNLRDFAREDFAIYLLSGLVFYHVFTRGTLSGLVCIRSNHVLIKSIRIPNEFFPVSTTTATSLFLIIEVGVLFILMPFFGFVPTWTIVFLPIIMGLMILLVLGVTYILSLIYVFTTDIHPIWGVTVHALFFVTPIFWYVQDAGGFLLTVHQFNPVGQLLELAHQVVFFGQVPPLTDWLYTGFFVGIIFLIGYSIFHKFESKIAEEL